MNGPYFVGVSGGKHFFRGLAELIRVEHPDLRGKNIFKQIDALGLREEFNRGTTPHSLPFSFSDYEGETSCVAG